MPANVVPLPTGSYFRPLGLSPLAILSLLALASLTRGESSSGQFISGSGCTIRLVTNACVVVSGSSVSGSGCPEFSVLVVEKAREAGKPEAMLEKIAEGTVQKYLKEVTLLGQVFVKAEDGKQTIEQLLKQKGAQVAGFTLYVVGEGIEKKVSDFAAEVAAQAAAAAAR